MLETRPRLQAVPEIASEIQESRKVVDAYCFDLDKDGDLYSPTAKCKVKDVVVRDNKVGALEGLAVDRINDWFKLNNEGAVAWVSPPDLQYYPTSKIIISEIINDQGKKRLLNRAIILDHNEAQVMELAQALGERSKNRPLLSNVNAVRSTPIFLDGGSWLSIISEAIDAPEVWNKVRTGQDLQDQEVALTEADKIYDSAIRGERLSYVGGGGGSCPESMGSKTGFGVFWGASSIMEGSYFDCPRCTKPIPSGKGITTCPHCGVRKEDYGNRCD